MAVYLLTGVLGGGKTIYGVLKLSEYFKAGSMVATNVKINPSHHLFAFTSAVDPKIIQLPAIPSFDDLINLGYGNVDQDVTKPGCLLLDEAGYWLNARNWNSKTNNELIEWFLMSRKLCWDIYLVVQDESQLDKQIRETCISFNIFSRTLFKHLGVSTCRRGAVNNSLSPVLWRKWWFRKSVYGAYDTQQIFSKNVNSGLSDKLGVDVDLGLESTVVLDIPAVVLDPVLQRKKQMIKFAILFFIASIVLFYFVSYTLKSSSDSNSRLSNPKSSSISPVEIKKSISDKSQQDDNSKVLRIVKYRTIYCKSDQNCLLTDVKGDVYAINRDDYVKGFIPVAGGRYVIK